MPTSRWEESNPPSFDFQSNTLPLSYIVLNFKFCRQWELNPRQWFWRPLLYQLSYAYIPMGGIEPTFLWFSVKYSTIELHRFKQNALYGNRTRVFALKGQCPDQLDEKCLDLILTGIEPITSHSQYDVLPIKLQEISPREESNPHHMFCRHLHYHYATRTFCSGLESNQYLAHYEWDTLPLSYRKINGLRRNWTLISMVTATYSTIKLASFFGLGGIWTHGPFGL